LPGGGKRNMNYVEEVDKAYDEFQDVYMDLERLVRTTGSGNLTGSSY